MIVAKIIEIIKNEFIKAASVLPDIKWNDASSRVTIPTQQMSKIITMTKQLLRSVEEILDKDDLRGIFSEIVQEVEKCFLNVYINDIKIREQIGAKRMMEELNYFMTTWQEIELLKEMSEVEA